MLISCHLVGVNRSSRPPRNGPRRPASAAPGLRSSTCSTTSTADVRPNRASGARGSRFRFPIVAVVSPPVSRPDETLDSISVSPALVVRVVEHTETPIRSVDSPASNVSVPLVVVHIVPGP